mmetsp:Transcript_25744/g.66805  ORF Transcript_25744/g.66805 Transcript_25744/m.66805 type:complete len:345 (-) Transcript_25744:120-1154(-)
MAGTGSSPSSQSMRHWAIQPPQTSRRNAWISSFWRPMRFLAFVIPGDAASSGNSPSESDAMGCCMPRSNGTGGGSSAWSCLASSANRRAALALKARHSFVARAACKASLASLEASLAASRALLSSVASGVITAPSSENVSRDWRPLASANLAAALFAFFSTSEHRRAASVAATAARPASASRALLALCDIDARAAASRQSWAHASTMARASRWAFEASRAFVLRLGSFGACLRSLSACKAFNAASRSARTAATSARAATRAVACRRSSKSNSLIFSSCVCLASFAEAIAAAVSARTASVLVSAFLRSTKTNEASLLSWCSWRFACFACWILARHCNVMHADRNR